MPEENDFVFIERTDVFITPDGNVIIADLPRGMVPVVRAIGPEDVDYTNETGTDIKQD